MKRVLVVACVLVCALASTASARDASLTPPANSGISQYTEAIPTGGGSTPAGRIPTGPAAKLPPAAARALRGPGATRRELSMFVGATAPRSARSATVHGTPSPPASADAGGSSVPGSLLRSLGGSGGSGGSGGMGVALPLILVACLFVAAGVVGRRRSRA